MLNIKKILVITSLLCVLVNVTSSKKVVCYYTNWAQYRPAGGKFFPEDVDANLCTHLIYSFAKLTSASELGTYEWNDESMYQRVYALKAKNPNLKIMIAVGGWNAGSAGFSNMVTDTSLRQKFVSTTVTFLTKYKFDGLDLDWEYPGSNAGSRPTDKQLFTTLIKELKSAFASRGLLLSAAVSIGISSIEKGFEISKISQDLDFINLMAYDFHGSWESILGFNAPLYSNDQLSVDYVVKYWISKGASPDKLILGLGNYGRSFRKSSSSNIAGSGASGSGTPARFTVEPGYMAYYEICENIKVNGWTEAYDTNAQAAYAYKGDQWVGYDNVHSMTLKTQYANSKSLGGIMFWALDLDDFKGTFCGEGTYPLVRAAVSALRDEASTPYMTTTTIAQTTTISSTTVSTTSVENNALVTTTSVPSSSRCFRGDGFYVTAGTGCKSFYRCIYSGFSYETAIEYTCQDGLLFDAVLNYCNWADQVTCEVAGVLTTTVAPVTTTASTTTPSTTTPSTTTAAPSSSGCFRGDGFYAEPGCKSYYRCVYSGTRYEKAIRYPCQAGLLFDARYNFCNWANQVTCNV